MNLPRLDFLSLKLRISLGYIIICTVLICVGLISFFGFAKSENHFHNLQIIIEQARLHSAIESDVFEMQGRVQQYIYEGRKFSENKVYNLFDHLNEELNTARKSARGEVTKGIITYMIERLKVYSEVFQEVVIERNLKYHLLKEKLVDGAKISENSLLEYIQLEKIAGNIDHLTRAQLIMNSILKIEKNTYTYLDTLDSTFVTDAKKNFNNIRRDIRELIEKEKTKSENRTKHRDVELLTNTQSIVSTYEADWFRMIETTRGTYTL